MSGTRSQRPRYQQIATDLRVAISNGTYQPGSTIPRETDLMESYGASRWTVRQAVSALQQEGLVTPIRHRGTVVRDRSPVRLPLSRYRHTLESGGTHGPWERACASQGLAGVAEVVTVDHPPAPLEIAESLEVAPGTHTVYRRRHMWAGDQIAQIQEAWTPLSLVEGTPLAGSAKVEGGVYAAFGQVGHSPTTVTEAVAARPATAEESEVMSLAVGTPVLEIQRVTRDQDGVVIELLQAATDGDRAQVLYEDLPVRPRT